MEAVVGFSLWRSRTISLHLFGKLESGPMSYGMLVNGPEHPWHGLNVV